MERRRFPICNENKIISQGKQRPYFFTGYVDDSKVYKYAAAADIQCVPSLWEEAAGLVAIEAMAGGIPTIVTNSGGMTEYVNEDTSLIIERAGIKKNLENAICYLKDNPEVRQQMSENGRKQSRKYDEQVYYNNFVKTVYEIEQDNRAT